MINIQLEWIAKNSKATQTQYEEVNVGDFRRINPFVCQDGVPEGKSCVRTKVPVKDIRT